MVGSDQLELRCAACGTRVRIRLKPGRVVSAIPCPSCKTPIRIDDEETGVTKTDARLLFGRSKFPEHEDLHAPEPPTSDDSGSRFKDVTQVAVDREVLAANSDLRPEKKRTVVSETPSEQRPPVPEAKRARPMDDSDLRRRLKAKLKSVEPGAVEPKPIEAPDPEPAAEPAAEPVVEPIAELAEPAILEPDVSDTPDPQPVEPPKLAIPEPPPVQQPTVQPPTSFTHDDLQRGLNMRVDGVSYGVLDPGRLEQIVSSGVWPGAVDVETPHGWITLERHPALPLIRERLAQKAQVALAQISQEVDRESLDIPTSERNVDASSQSGDAFAAPSPQPINRWAVVSAILLVVCAVGVYAWVNRPEPKPIVQQPKTLVAPPEATEFATYIADRALTMTNDGAQLRNRDPSELMTDAEASLARANFGDALDALFELRRRNPKQKTVLEMLVKAQLGARRFRDARETIITLAAIDPEQQLDTLFRDAVQQDASLGWEVLEVGVDIPLDQIKALGGGKSVSFKFKRDGRNVFAFKPSQHEWEEGWRGEIAAYRFCELANCGFRVPRSRPAKVSRAVLEKLYPMDTEWQKGYADRFEEIVWTTEVVDGKSVEFAYGVMKDWIPHFADWPIEYTDIWIEWLNPSIDKTNEYDKPLEKAMAIVAERNPQTWRKLKREFADVSVKTTAAQISNLLVFDFLINNWDRFSDKEEYYGVNNQFADGRFISLDNGAGFGLRHSSRVEERFEIVGRYSREMLASVELIDETYQGFLMPDPSDTERRRMALFWERRSQLRKRVKEQIGKHDEKLVLAFD